MPNLPAVAYGVVYRITCNANGKRYHGQTVNFYARKPCHFRSNNGCVALRNAIKKYGRSCFVFEILAVAASRSELDLLEQLWVATSLAPVGYNLRHGGNDRRASAVTRARISKSGKVAQNRPEVRLKNSQGVKRALARPDVKAQLSASLKAYSALPWVRERRSKLMREVHARPGQAEKRSASIKASWAAYAPDERAARIDELRATFTPQRRERMAATSREVMSRPDVKARHKASLKAYYERPGVREQQGELQRQIHARPGQREKRSASLKAAWAAYTPDEREARIAKMRAAITPERRAQMAEATRAFRSRPDVKEAYKESSRRAWSPERREANREATKTRWTDPDYHKRVGAAISEATRGKARKTKARRDKGTR
jgi:group I intron endonuclease